jgi:sec-independent protein translocase protein TatB
MLDVGYSELLVIAIVLIVVVGPKDLPKMLRAFGSAMTRFRKVSGDFRRQFDEALKEAELDEVKNTINSVRGLDPRTQIRNALNPLTSAVSDIKRDVTSAVTPPTPTQIIPKVSEMAPVAPPPVVEEPKPVKKPRAKPVRRDQVVKMAVATAPVKAIKPATKKTAVKK